MMGILKISPLTYVACAVSRGKLIVTVQNSEWYSGPGRPKNVALNLEFDDAYSRVLGLTERIFGKENMRLEDAHTRKKSIYVNNYKAKSGIFFNSLIGFSRGETLDKKLDS